MVHFICDKCHKIFDKKSTYQNHLKRKNPCAPSGTRIDKLEEIVESQKEKIKEINEKLEKLLQEKEKN